MRISTTVLESFRLFMEPEQEWMEESELLDTICNRWTPNHLVNIGQAFGLVLRDPERFKVSGGYRVTPRGTTDVIELDDDVMDPALALIDRAHAVFEPKAVGVYAGHDVVTKADQLVGAQIIETKARLSSFDFDKYAASCQWRYLLDTFQAKALTYQVYCLHEATNNVISLNSIETFTLYPYAGMRQDCERLVRDFDAYVTAKGLKDALDARQVELAGAF